MIVLAISTSPREGSNTDLLVDEVLRGAAEVGASVEKIAVRHKRIAPCAECDKCRLAGECVIRDDMHGIYPKLLAADRVLFASPIFFLTVCAQAKAVIDRCQCLWARKFKLQKRLLNRQFQFARQGYFLTTAGGMDDGMFEHARVAARVFFETIEAEYTGELVYGGVDEREEILDHPTAMKDAFELGRALGKGA